MYESQSEKKALILKFIEVKENQDQPQTFCKFIEVKESQDQAQTISDFIRVVVRKKSWKYDIPLESIIRGFQ